MNHASKWFLLGPILATFTHQSYSASLTFPQNDIIPNQFIVRLTESHTPVKVAEAYGISPKYTYKAAINGFAAIISPDVLERIKNDPRVVTIEQDKVVRVDAMDVLATTWGIDRIDQRNLPLDGLYNYSATAANVTAYVLDTGIRYDHQEFGTRATFGYDSFGEDGSDCHGHGTHVSGTIGGATYGVAKEIKLKAVRVLDCNGSGSLSGVIAGVDWVTANRTLPAVANMSLGLNGISDTIDAAVAKMINSGVATSIAAGNSNADACNNSPARVPSAMTMGASTQTDERASFSNWGNCVDWFSPGDMIESAWNTGNLDVKTLSGTSMAAPHTAGAAALYLQNHPSANPIQVRDALYAMATKNMVANSNSPNNHLLYTLESNTPPTDDTTAPTVILKSPRDGSRYYRWSNILLAADANDNVNVTAVSFFANGTLICTDTTAPYGCYWKPSAIVRKSIKIHAQGYDSAGNVGHSQMATIRTF